MNTQTGAQALQWLCKLMYLCFLKKEEGMWKNTTTSIVVYKLRRYRIAFNFLLRLK